MPKKDKPPTAEEIAEMLGVAPEKVFKVDKEDMGKVRAPATRYRLVRAAVRLGWAPVGRGPRPRPAGRRERRPSVP